MGRECAQSAPLSTDLRPAAVTERRRAGPAVPIDVSSMQYHLFAGTVRGELIRPTSTSDLPWCSARQELNGHANAWLRWSTRYLLNPVVSVLAALRGHRPNHPSAPSPGAPSTAAPITARSSSP